MVILDQLASYCDQLLKIGEFDDYCPNGLQVEGRREVRRIASGVTASQALIEAALEFEADLLLVHHGYFWKGEPAVITGMRRRRLGMLLGSNMSLLAYHLPLDAHPQLGNNVQLARALGWKVETAPGQAGVQGLLWHGRLPQALSGEALAGQLTARLGRSCLWIAGHDRAVETLAWCTGGAQDFIDQAADLGVDAYVSGEISEQTTHVARERGIDYFAAGHHATERYGARALGAHLAENFGLEHRFIDIDNPA